MHRLKRTQFWGRDQDDDRLLHQVFDGHKTATADLAKNWHIPIGDYDDGGYVAGDIVEVYDRRGTLRCHIRITEVYQTPFGSIPEKLWRGEACTSAEDFRRDHESCWSDEKPTDETPIIGCHFELISVVNPFSTTTQKYSPLHPSTVPTPHDNSLITDTKLDPSGKSVTRSDRQARGPSPVPRLFFCLHPAPLQRFQKSVCPKSFQLNTWSTKPKLGCLLPHFSNNPASPPLLNQVRSSDFSPFRISASPLIRNQPAQVL
ncbi:ASCH domain-containing protein [Prosthecobacter sp.]|uniref:ASCH domain-containing protein n=1 Tax=Prosthecobacter sp. TaxID=1965333 RepID=UPI00378369AF